MPLRGAMCWAALVPGAEVIANQAQQSVAWELVCATCEKPGRRMEQAITLADVNAAALDSSNQ